MHPDWCPIHEAYDCTNYDMLRHYKKPCAKQDRKYENIITDAVDFRLKYGEALKRNRKEAE